ncbi:unnamed protein product [Eruca vesicaria subsp. sativa]|uniref:Uncharacterized protein n=1 Tax=Eruca vesicaria subsp. sativa TaxID=29727 RepID=A0ABC8M8T4_ERUVS|nr:unnamed protein product [Eruca vesicaria subsp. sativa]
MAQQEEESGSDGEEEDQGKEGPAVRSKSELQEFPKPSLRRTTGKACSTKKSPFLKSSFVTKFMDSFAQIVFK